LWELWGREEGPRGEILTPATMGGEQRRATVTEIMDENGREREMGLTCFQGLKRGGESFRMIEKGGQRERKEGDNSHIHTYMFTHINHCHIIPAIGQGFLISLEHTRDCIYPQ
jgi:hypothetical protein